MKRTILVVFLAVLVLGLEAGARAQAPAPDAFPGLKNDPLFDQGTYEKLREIPVDVSWNNVDLKTALRDLTLLALRADPEREELIFRFSTAATPEARQRKVSFQGEQVSVFTVLESLGAQASFQITIHRNIVLIEPAPVPGTAP
jgi:hypothetical protein